MATNSFYEFGPFRLDRKTRLLLHGHDIVPLTPKAVEALVVLIDNHGTLVTKEELMKAVWPDAFVEETNLTQNISTVRKALGESPEGRPYIETIPKRGYRFVATVKETSADEASGPGAGIVERKRGWTVTLVATLLFATAGAGLIMRIMERSRRASGTDAVDRPASVAVLPFLDMSSAKDQEYFCDGLTEELIDALAKVDGLQVVSRTSSFTFRGKQEDIREIGAKLKVRAVLEGSVRKAGERLRITAQLNNAGNGYHLWSQTYDREIRDVFSVQEEIAQAIVKALEIHLSAESGRPLLTRHTANMEAYNLYLKGRYFWNKHNPDGVKKGREYFQQAIGMDPQYAVAYSGLADSFVEGPVDLAPGEAFPSARKAATKALDLNETLAEAHSSLAMVRFLYDWDWPAAEREFQRAVQLNPNYASAHHWYSHYLTAVARPVESLREARRALELDPLETIINTHLQWHYYYARQYDQALEQCRKTLELDPAFWSSNLILGKTYAQKGMYPQAIASLLYALSLAKDDTSMRYLGNVYAISGKAGEARKVLAEMKELSKRRYVSPYSLALVHTGLGEKDQAFEWLQRAYAEHSPWLVYILVEPELDSLRSDPRFSALLKKMAFPG